MKLKHWRQSVDAITCQLHSHYICLSLFPIIPADLPPRWQGHNCFWGGEEPLRALDHAHYLLPPIRMRGSLLRGWAELGRSRATVHRHRSVRASAALWSVLGAWLCVPSTLSWIRLDPAVFASRMKVCLHISGSSAAWGNGNRFRTDCYFKWYGILSCLSNITVILKSTDVVLCTDWRNGV